MARIDRYHRDDDLRSSSWGCIECAERRRLSRILDCIGTIWNCAKIEIGVAESVKVCRDVEVGFLMYFILLAKLASQATRGVNIIDGLLLAINHSGQL